MMLEIASVTQTMIRISLMMLEIVLVYTNCDQDQFSDAGDSISYTNCDQDQFSDVGDSIYYTNYDQDQFNDAGDSISLHKL